MICPVNWVGFLKGWLWALSTHVQLSCNTYSNMMRKRTIWSCRGCVQLFPGAKSCYHRTAQSNAKHQQHASILTTSHSRSAYAYQEYVHLLPHKSQVSTAQIACLAGESSFYQHLFALLRGKAHRKSGTATQLAYA